MLSKLSTALILIALAVPCVGNRQQITKTDSQQKSADEVTLTVTVTDNKGRPVMKVSKDAFTVYDEKKPQEITFFAHKDEPLSLGVILDVSGSIRDRNKNMPVIVKENLERFIQQSNRSNDYFVLSFSDCAKLIVNWTSDGSEIVNALSKFNMPKLGSTALYDACYSATEKLKQSSNQKRVLLVVTDGQDNSSQAKYKELRELLRRSEVSVYFIFLGDELTDSLAGYGRSIANEISTITGGRIYNVRDSRDMNESFRLLALELRFQYRIGYKLANYVADGKWRKVKVKVNPIEVEDLTKPDRPRKKMDLTGRTREGYYTAKQ